MSSRYLYPTLLESEWDELPLSVRLAHFCGEPVRLTGTLEVSVGEGWFARFLCKLLGMPTKSAKLRTELQITQHDDGERWLRIMGGRTWQTLQTRHGPYLREAAGPFLFDFNIVRDGPRLCFQQQRLGLRLFGSAVPIPRWVGVHVEAEEAAADDPNLVSISVRARFYGGRLLIGYQGCLRDGIGKNE